MIGCFPDPYPDELLYSVAARFTSRMHFPTHSTTSSEFFGHRHVDAVVDLPTRIDYLINALPPGHQYSAEGFINNHTLLPLYAPFLQVERVQDILALMRRGGDHQPGGKLGIHSSSIGFPARLRFCPRCVKEDHKRFGETYWHRIHQISGIEVCPQHSIFLEQSAALWQLGTIRFVSAGEAITVVPLRRLDTSQFKHLLLLKLALNAEWLLQRGSLDLGPEILRERYFNMLLERGYALPDGRIKISKLMEDFEAFYSNELLAKLRCSVSNRGSCWLRRICMESRLLIAQHPLHHLLLMTFFGCTVEEVFTTFKEYKPFGDGPWLCVNRASNHYGEMRVTDCRIVRSNNRETYGKPMGIFSCSCGFRYTRPWRQKAQEGSHEVGSVQEYGSVWEESLRKLWESNDISIQQVAVKLGVSQETVTKQAQRLGLKHPRDTRYSKPLRSKNSKTLRLPRKSINQLLESRRLEWLSALKSNPDAGRAYLRAHFGSLYKWLARYDREWFESTLPASRKTQGRATRTDWGKVDIEFSNAIETAAAYIRSSPGQPVRVSLAAITKQTGYLIWIQRCPDKIPCTVKTLAKTIESREDFAFRQIQWAEDCFREEGICPTRYGFERKAHTQNEVGKTPIIQRAVDTAMARLAAQFRSSRDQLINQVIPRVA